MIAEEFEHKGLQIEIHYEEDNEHCDPRQWDNLGTMVCWHPEYALGDYQLRNPEGRGAINKPFTTENGRADFDSFEVLERYLRLVEQAPVVLPLAIYDHSGISMFVGSRGDYPFDTQGWDTTTIGFIYTTPKRIKELGVENDPKVIAEQLRQEVKQYDSWLTGEVYWYGIRSPEGEIMGSCGGFVGDISFAKEEAILEADDLAHDLWVEQEPGVDMAEMLTHE